MAPYRNLPTELLEYIASFLHEDSRTLRNFSLTCHFFDIIAKPHLFELLDFRNLGVPGVKPFLPFVRHLHVVWGTDMFKEGETQVLDRLLIPNLSADIMPRLESLVVVGIGSRGSALLSTQEKRFSTFASLKTLDLRDVHHRSFREVQGLICALPLLADLQMGHVSWNQHDGYEEEVIAEWALQRPRLESLDVSPTFPDKTLRLVQWLATTPSNQSLKQLVIPFRAHNAPELLSSFGPTIERLTTPIRRMQTSLFNYASLRSLTLLIQKYSPTSRWDALPAVLSSLPHPPLLHTLNLYLELGRIRFEDEVSEANLHCEKLEEVDRVLFPQPSKSGVPAPTSAFSSLQTVNFIARTSYPVSKARIQRFEETVRRLMPRCSADNKFNVSFESY